MPRYAVLDGFCLGTPRGDVYPGDTVELTEREARPHLQIGRLRLVEAAPAGAEPDPPPPPPAPAAPAATLPAGEHESRTQSRRPRGAGKEE